MLLTNELVMLAGRAPDGRTGRSIACCHHRGRATIPALAALDAVGTTSIWSERRMAALRWLALLPFLLMLAGLAFCNRVTPLVLGMPLLLAWMLFCCLLTSVIMGIIYLADPANRE